MMERTAKTGSAVVVVCVSLMLLVFCASPAFAGRGRDFGGSFGSAGSGAGQLSLSAPVVGQSAGSGLAVNDVTHDVYVADTGNHRVDEFTAEGAFVRAWGWGVSNGSAEPQTCTATCRQGLSGTALGQFEAPASIAVDNSPGGEGDVYVAEAGDDSLLGDSFVQKFTSEGALVEAWGSKGRISRNPTTKATITGDLTSGSTEVTGYEVTSGSLDGGGEILGEGVPANDDVDEWNVVAHTIKLVTPASTTATKVALTLHIPFQAIAGLAVDAAGDLWIADGTGLHEYDRAGGILQAENKIATPETGVAIDASGALYVSESFSRILKLDSSATVLGYVFATENFAPVTGLAVNSTTGELYVDEGGSIATVAPSCVPFSNLVEAEPPFCPAITRFDSPELTGGAGLAVDSQRETVYIAETATSTIESIVPEPPASPLVEAGSQTVADASGDSVTLEAAVNPRSEPSEEPTSYYFQYTPEERFQREGFTGASSIPAPDGQLAPSYEADLVTAHPQGLSPGTVYRYRLVAENEISRREGKPTEGERDETGKEVVRSFTTQSQGVFALPDGRAWELVSPPNKHGAKLELPFEHGGAIQASANGEAVTYEASAPTESGPPANPGTTQVLSTRGASSWSSVDISLPREAAQGWDQVGGEYVFFSSDLSLSAINPFGAFLPSLSAEASEQTAYLRNDFPKGDPSHPCVSSCYHPFVTGAPGFANVPEGTEFGGESFSKCSGLCGPQFLGATPDGRYVVLQSNAALVEGAPAESLYEWAEGQLTLVSVLPESQGGGPAPASGTPALGSSNGNVGNFEYVAHNAISTDGSRVVWSTLGNSNLLYLRDVAHEETVQLGGREASFLTASSDGSRVFFDAGGGGDLQVFEAPSGSPLSAGHVTDLGPGAGVLGASEDASSLYFVTDGAVTGSEANERGETAVVGQPNLYLYHAGETKLIAVLSNEDRSGGVGLPTRETVRVSPSGGWAEFMSDRSLTGYDNRDASSGKLDEEVFLYDEAGDGRGKLVCASCDPTGARPHGVFDAGTTVSRLLADEGGAWAGHWLAANVQAWPTPFEQPRNLSDSGRLFFDSPDGLSPSDTNGVEDVYEYEPSGVGDCTSASSTYSARSDGCVALISSGTSKEESAFIDASESGDDVFFMTSAQLSPADTDTVPDIYDARVGGGFPLSQPPPACEGDACQSPVAAPSDPTPGSLTYQGSGNPAPAAAVKKIVKKTIRCSKAKKLSHGKCVARKQKTKKKTHRSGKSSSRRGA